MSQSPPLPARHSRCAAALQCTAAIHVTVVMIQQGAARAQPASPHARNEPLIEQASMSDLDYASRCPQAMICAFVPQIRPNQTLPARVWIHSDAFLNMAPMCIHLHGMQGSSPQSG